ncbi:hypothetical protein EIP86_007004 [Pleurotus ostreatoroseus]|nr:hypothetical protein EIP86_007004 [Pleurotus ostreatoroseus]
MAELGPELTRADVKPVALDWDVITSIMDYVEKKRDVLAFMHTCHNQNEDSSDAVDLLSRLQSPLSQLKVNFWADYEAPVSLLLTTFSQTLESLTLECQTFVSSDVCFPRLTMLKVQMATLPQLPSLMAACPNLQELDIMIKGSYPEHVGPLRSQNIAFQVANAANLWTSLRRVTAQSLFLYTMGLRQEIETLTIADRLYTSIGCRGPDETRALYRLQWVLLDARPRALTLRHTFADLNDFRRIWRAVSGIFSTENLTLEFHPLTPDPHRTLITISKALQIGDNSSVQKLTLRFYMDREHETHNSRKPDMEFYERWVKKKLSRPCDVHAEIRDDMVVF